MEKKRGRLIEIVGSVAAAAVVVLFLWVALNQPVPASTQSPSGPISSPPLTSAPPPTDQTSAPPAGAPGGTPPGGHTGSTGSTPSTPPALGNGHKVPNGWANAACPDHGKGKGVQARCGFSATYGALEKAGLAGSLITDPSSQGKTQAASEGSRAALHASANGNSVASGNNPGHHAGQH